MEACNCKAGGCRLAGGEIYFQREVFQAGEKKSKREGDSIVGARKARKTERK